jgi:predicted aspartyl protease
MSVFLRGHITPEYLPIVEEFFLVGPQQDTPVEMILDTGFSGMVILPRRVQPLGTFELTGVTRYELADGTTIDTELYKTTIRIGQRPLTVDTSFTDSEPGMIGMALLAGKRAIFDLKRNTLRVQE